MKYFLQLLTKLATQWELPLIFFFGSWLLVSGSVWVLLLQSLLSFPPGSPQMLLTFLSILLLLLQNYTLVFWWGLQPIETKERIKNKANTIVRLLRKLST